MRDDNVEVEGFDPNEWDIRRKSRQWTDEEFEKRIYQAPEKIEFVGGIFTSEAERLTVLAMLLENLGIDKIVSLGSLDDWKSAIADVQRENGEGD